MCFRHSIADIYVCWSLSVDEIKQLIDVVITGLALV